MRTFFHAFIWFFHNKKKVFVSTVLLILHFEKQYHKYATWISKSAQCINDNLKIDDKINGGKTKIIKCDFKELFCFDYCSIYPKAGKILYKKSIISKVLRDGNQFSKFYVSLLTGECTFNVVFKTADIDYIFTSKKFSNLYFIEEFPTHRAENSRI